MDHLLWLVLTLLLWVKEAMQLSLAWITICAALFNADTQLRVTHIGEQLFKMYKTLPLGPETSPLNDVI